MPHSSPTGRCLNESMRLLTVLALSLLMAGSGSAASGGSERHGVQFFADYADPARTARKAELARELGVGWVRLHVAAHSPLFEQERTWRPTDTVVSTLRQNGLKILGGLMLGGPAALPPDWPSIWTRYVLAAVTRYASEIDYWEVGNEPDLRYYWSGTPRQYAQALSLAAKEIRRIDPKAKVVLGGLALGGRNRDANFLEDILRDKRYPAARSFDIANFHSYGDRAATKQGYDYVRASLRSVKAGRKPVWLTEIGAASEPAGARAERWRGPEGQALYLRDLVPYALGLGVAKVFVFQLHDNPNTRGFESYGLLDGSLQPKLAYEAYRELIAAG